jgi:peptidoglycan-N-acetylglucosamine deacetylase
VLGALQSEDAVATFFLVGEQVEAHPELARRIASGGHAIGLHCHQHRRHSELGEGVADDLRRGLAAIEGATGVRPRLWRPPYGRFTERSFSACREARLEPVYWSAWGWDWEEIAAERIAELALRDLGPGAIVLLHDSARYAHRRDAAPTAEAVSAVLKRAREAGLEPAPLA